MGAVVNIGGQGPYMSIEECAAYIHLKPSTLYKKTSKGLIPYRKHFSRVVFVRSEIDDWSAKQLPAKKETENCKSRFESARERVRSLKTKYTAEAKA